MFQSLKNAARYCREKLSGAALALGLMVGAATGLVAPPASAAPVDVTAVVTAITDTLTPVGLIGVAVLTVLVAIKTYKWVRRAM